MTLMFEGTLEEALRKIELREQYTAVIPTQIHSQEEFLDHYGRAKWEIVDKINSIFGTAFDLYNWLHFDERDEVAYFLNEAGSNVLNYSESKKPVAFHLWVGTKGFVLGIEQEGKGFDAVRVAREGIRENEGAGFMFFQNCKSEIFFNQPTAATIVFMQWMK